MKRMGDRNNFCFQKKKMPLSTKWIEGHFFMIFRTRKMRFSSFFNTRVTISARKLVPLYCFFPFVSRVEHKKRLALPYLVIYHFYCRDKKSKSLRKEQVRKRDSYTLFYSIHIGLVYQI